MALNKDDIMAVGAVMTARAKPILNDIAVDISAGLYEVHERIDDLADAMISQQTDSTIILQVVQQLAREVAGLKQCLQVGSELGTFAVNKQAAAEGHLWLQSSLRL